MIFKPQPIPQGARLLTYRQVAQLLQVSERTVDRLVKSGDLPRVYLGPTAVRIDLRDVESYIDRNKRTAVSGGGGAVKEVA